jgi:hypothetical protein
MPHEMKITVTRLVVLNLRWPYHAKVMKMLEASKRPIVATGTGRDMAAPLGGSGCYRGA